VIARTRLAASQSWRRGGACPADDGFAAVDAMVALVILSSTIILALGVVDTGRRAAVKAVEIRKATSLLRGLLETTPGQVGSISGTASGFNWQVLTVVANDDGPIDPIKLCDRNAKALSRASGRKYALTQTEICPAEVKP